MSIEARQTLVSHLVLQRASQRTDLLSLDLTQTGLIALLLDLVNAGFNMEVTSVRSDHRDDSGLGEHSHANGYCVDLWPLNSFTAGDYMDAGSPAFRSFLEAVADSEYLHQIGLAGSAVNPENLEAAGPTAFLDEGADHIHIGATNVP